MFGPFQVTEELSLTQHGSVARARKMGEEPAVYAIKRFNPPAGDPNEPHWESAVFLDRARAQQQLAASGAAHWAAIHQVGVSDSGVWFATDYLPLSVQKLIDGKISHSEKTLFSIIDSILRGLLELADARSRPHGDLKASNVLIAGKDLNTARVLLTDLGSPAQAAKAGEAGDVFALGEILHGLVMHRPFTAGEAWPLPPEAQWDKLGPHGPMWRQFCNDLLVPVASLRLPLASVQRRLDELSPPRRLRLGRRWMIAAVVPIVLFLAGFAALSFMERSARQQFSRSRDDWFAAFAAALNDSARRQHYAADADLRHAMDQLDRENLVGLDPSPRGYFHASLHDWRKFKYANATLASIQHDLSPQVWPALTQAANLRDHLEDLTWQQPAEFVGRLIDGAKLLPGNDAAGGIDRLLEILPRITEKLPDAEQDWKRLVARTTEIRAKKDKLLTTLADALKTSSAVAIQVSDAGFFRLDTVNQNAELADRLADAVRSAWPNDVDRARLNRDVAAALDVDHLRTRDIEKFMNLLALNTVRHDEASLAASRLRKRLEDNSIKINASHPDAQETIQFERDRADDAAQILAFEQSPFTLRMISDGTFNDRSSKIQAAIDALVQKYYHPDGPEDWLKSLPSIVTSSQRVNEAWEAWKLLLRDENTIAEMTRNRQNFDAYRARTDKLQKLLVRLDSEFPPVPADLSQPFTQAAKNRRELDLARPIAFIDRIAITLDPAIVQAAQVDYVAWTANLIALAREFPLNKEILTLDDRPDEMWKQQQPVFWNDPAIVALVKPDMDRVNAVQSLRQSSRPDLVKAAQDSREPEIALAAWQLLGSEGTQPPWPSHAGELSAELGLRDRITGMLSAADAPPTAAALLKDMTPQEPVRWERFVENAASEAMLEEAIKNRQPAGAGGEQIAALSPTARYNFWTYMLRQGVALNKDELVRSAAANLRLAAQELKDHPETSAVSVQLAQLDAREPFGSLNPGVSLALPGVLPPMEFHRVEPTGGRPFYLATTEVSFAQFKGVIQAASAWGEVKKLPWNAMPGQRDARRGPRIWEWTEQPALSMTNPQYWLTPDDDNDFPAPLRAGRFNRMVLADAVGGPPEPDHPMQQISAQAALYYAALCACRLPTPGEWKAAYDQFEKVGPTERWNLRDQTWQQAQRYVTQLRASHWPDDGIFHPENDTSPTADAATATGVNDGALYFRHVNSPGSGSTFRHLEGNVAEFVCDAADGFEQWPQKKTAEGIRQFVEQNARSMFVIGGSALSPPQQPVDKPLALPRTDAGYADVGLRLAFTAPARSLAERARWIFGEPHYIWAPSATVRADGQ